MRIGDRCETQDLERARAFYADKLGLETIDAIADIEGDYPSKGSGERCAWFRDGEGSLLGIGQPLGG